MSNTARGLAMLGLLMSTTDVAPGAQMRSRSEGVPGVQASNTVGLGDIWVGGALSSQFSIRPIANDALAEMVDSSYRGDFRALYGAEDKLRRDMRMVPTVSGVIGLAGFLHIELQSIPWDGEKLGASTARLKVTTPGNDNLRVFGLGFSLNATLSTEEDIYARGETTPGFDPLLYFTVIADLDLIKLAGGHPYKMYLNYSNLDDHTLSKAYSQHLVAMALERKGARAGWWMRLSAMMYKPLPTRFNPEPRDEYLSTSFELGLGYRASLSDRVTVAGELSLDPIDPIRFYDKEVSKPPRLHVEVSVPIVYTETRGEAIRSLIFNEQERKRLRRLAARNPSVKAAGRDSASVPGQLRLDELSLENRKTTDTKDLLKGVFEEPEDDVPEKRKQIRSQLKQIEELLE